MDLNAYVNILKKYQIRQNCLQFHFGKYSNMLGLFFHSNFTFNHSFRYLNVKYSIHLICFQFIYYLKFIN